jgi:hypothetical protein
MSYLRHFMTRPSLIFSLCFFAYPFYPAMQAYGQPTSSLASALIVGTDSSGRTLFLCRSLFNGGLHLGIIWAGANQCTFSYEGLVHAATQYTIPNQTEFGQYIWKDDSAKAIKVGQNAKGPLFLCQANMNGHLLPGTTWPGYNYCNIIYQEKEVVTKIKSVLSSM